MCRGRRLVMILVGHRWSARVLSIVVIGRQQPHVSKRLEAGVSEPCSHLPTAAVDIHQEARRPLSRRWRQLESGRGYTPTPPVCGGCRHSPVLQSGISKIMVRGQDARGIFTIRTGPPARSSKPPSQPLAARLPCAVVVDGEYGDEWVLTGAAVRPRGSVVRRTLPAARTAGCHETGRYVGQGITDGPAMTGVSVSACPDRGTGSAR
jgi:hypothetical protein